MQEVACPKNPKGQTSPPLRSGAADLHDLRSTRLPFHCQDFLVLVCVSHVDLTRGGHPRSNGCLGQLSLVGRRQGRSVLDRFLLFNDPLYPRPKMRAGNSDFASDCFGQRAEDRKRYRAAGPFLVPGLLVEHGTRAGSTSHKDLPQHLTQALPLIRGKRRPCGQHRRQLGTAQGMQELLDPTLKRLLTLWSHLWAGLAGGGFVFGASGVCPLGGQVSRRPGSFHGLALVLGARRTQLRTLATGGLWTTACCLGSYRRGSSPIASIFFSGNKLHPGARSAPEGTCPGVSFWPVGCWRLLACPGSVWRVSFWADTESSKAWLQPTRSGRRQRRLGAF